MRTFATTLSRGRTAATALVVAAVLAAGLGLSADAPQAQAKGAGNRAPTTGTAKPTPGPGIKQTGVKGTTTGKNSKSCVKYQRGCPRPGHDHTH